MHQAKMKSLFIAALFIVLSLVSGCSDNSSVSNKEQIVGSGKLVSETRAVAPFTGIQLVGSGNVVITHDTVQTLTVETDDNILGLLSTSVENGLLIVSLKDGSYSNITVNIHASMKTVNLLECVGSGQFTTSGSVNTDVITCRITGAGSMTLNGTARSETIEIDGAGEIHNFGLVSSTCSAAISGAGNIEVAVTDELTASIAGSGVITYTGNPPTVHQTISGTGVIKARP